MINIKKHTLFSIAGLLFLANVAIFTMPSDLLVAKTSPAPSQSEEHVHDAVVNINGDDNPEQIQDKVAFRLFFLTASTDDLELQRNILAPANFSDSELAIVSAFLADFKKQHDAAVQEFNNSMAVASPENVPDSRVLDAQLDDLTLQTQKKIEKSVSKSSYRNLYAHVQGEKRLIHITRVGGN